MLIALRCRGCTLCFTRGASSLFLALVGSFDLQQHHLITSIAVRRVLVSFDGAEQRSFMQMPLQMNAQAFFFRVSFVIICLLSLILAKTRRDMQNGERESEEVRPPLLFIFWVFCFSKELDWRGRRLEVMRKWSLESARRGSARSPRLPAAALCANDRAVFAQRRCDRLAPF